MPGSGHSQPFIGGGENTPFGTLIQSTVVAVKTKQIVSRNILRIEIAGRKHKGRGEIKKKTFWF